MLQEGDIFLLSSFCSNFHLWSTQRKIRKLLHRFICCVCAGIIWGYDWNSSVRFLLWPTQMVHTQQRSIDAEISLFYSTLEYGKIGRVNPHLPEIAFFETTSTLMCQNSVLRGPFEMVSSAFESPWPVLFNHPSRFRNAFLSAKCQRSNWSRYRKPGSRGGGGLTRPILP